MSIEQFVNRVHNGHCSYKSFNRENCLRKDNKCIKD